MRSSAALAFPLGHQMILASAGSGKTHDLTTRFLTLMAAGVAPERIIALTFSKKAAGEFFARILRRLADAASSEESAAALESAMEEQERQHGQHLGQADAASGRAPLTQVRAQALLVELVRQLHRLMLGTMDSFFIRMARAMPLELGLSGDFSMLDEPQKLAARQRIYQQIFTARSTPRADQQEFIRAFQQATHGREEAGMVRNLNLFLKDCEGYFTEARPPQHWGQPQRIWRDGGAPREVGMSTAQAAAAALVWLELGKHPFNNKQLGAVQAYLEAMLEHGPLQPLPLAVQGFAKKLYEIYPDLQRGSAIITLWKKVTLAPPCCQHLLDVVDAQLQEDLAAGCQQMQGVWRILHRYDQHYEMLIRQPGQLTFSDVQQLLTGELAAVHAEDPQAQGFARELLDFRLDAQYDHWLLDEFQDTNGRQWRILEPLLAEVLQDDTGLRTFFAVGDVKQAVHMWRGSDPDLSGRLLERYNQPGSSAPARIATLAKAVSWRCAPTVLALANAVLTDQRALDEWLPPGTLARGWNYLPHAAAEKNLGLTGHAQVLVATQPEDAEESKEGQCYQVIAAQLRALDPLARGLSCAVLVKKNKQVLAAAEALRSLTGLRITCETEAVIVKRDPATAGLLDLLRLAAHPGHSLARRHLEMSPWLEVAAQRFPAAAANPMPLAASEVRRQVAHTGVAATLRSWTQALCTLRPALPAFSRERLEDLLSVATTYDATGSRDLDVFILLAEEHTMRQASAPQSIQVMTIFKAKGLEWDVVFLTGLEGKGKEDTYAVAYDEERHLEWITQTPSKSLALLNPTLKATEEARARWAWRQNICLLYVALTRAKRATHVVLPQPPKTSTAVNLATLLHAVLPPPTEVILTWDGVSAQQLWQAEDSTPEWYLEHPLRPAEPLPHCGHAPVPARLRTPRLPKRRPSDHPPQSFFSRERHYAMGLGSAIHALAAQLTWLDPSTAADLPMLARSLPVEFRGPALRQIQISLQQAAIRHVFTRPSMAVELWRERSFALIQDGEQISGTFDRVQIERDAAGVVMRALLVELKSDASRIAADQAATLKRAIPQVQLYRIALMKLLHLSAAHVSCQVVLLTKGMVIDVPPAG